MPEPLEQAKKALEKAETWLSTVQDFNQRDMGSHKLAVGLSNIGKAIEQCQKALRRMQS